MMRPFWRYYGSKWRAAPAYPKPEFDTIVEPFAGGAGYSLRYPDRQVILVDKYHVVAEIWRWLIVVSSDEVMAIPEVDAVDNLPTWVPQSARWLVGFCLAMGRQQPSSRLSPALLQRRTESAGRIVEGWTHGMKSRIASQVPRIRHWKIIEGDYTAAPNIEAAWFVDSPYRGEVGRRYTCSSNHLDYPALGRWCLSRLGQVIVCEAGGADWLPFSPLHVQLSLSGKRSQESVWTMSDPGFGWDPP